MNDVDPELVRALIERLGQIETSLERIVERLDAIGYALHGPRVET